MSFLFLQYNWKVLFQRVCHVARHVSPVATICINRVSILPFDLCGVRTDGEADRERAVCKGLVTQQVLTLHESEHLARTGAKS